MQSRVTPLGVAPFGPDISKEEFTMSDTIAIEPFQAGRRRHYTPEQKRSLLDETTRPGASVSEIARKYGVAPSMLFQWKRVMDDATKKGLKANERVVPESEVKKLEA